ncbi:MAG: TlpA disulfide reductase family protein [Armatimonadota bacterium]
MIIPLAIIIGLQAPIVKLTPLERRFLQAEDLFRHEVTGDRYMLSKAPPDYPADEATSKDFEDIAVQAGKTTLAIKAWTLALISSKPNLGRENKLMDHIVTLKVTTDDQRVFGLFWAQVLASSANKFQARDRLPKVFDPFIQGSNSKATTSSMLLYKAQSMPDILDLKWDVYNRLVEQYSGTEGAKRARAILLSKKNLQRGDEFPDFISKDSDSKKFRLSEMRDKVVVLEFWANWCPSCQRTIPVMQGVEKEFAGQPVEFIGINSDGDAPVVKEIQAKWAMTTRTLVDGSPTGPISTRYAIMAWPSFFVIGKDGKVVFRSSGIDADGMTKAIKEASK